MLRGTLGLLAVLLAMAGAALAQEIAVEAAQRGNLLANPSFELDEDGNGLPDGWNIQEEARGELTDEASNGKKAMRFAEGVVVINQNLSIDDLADRNFRVDVDARSPDGAKLGVFVGYVNVGEDEKAVWRNRRLVWDRSLGDDYTTFRFRHRIPANAKGPRVWVAIYRSNNVGTLYIDNAKATINDLSTEQQVALNRVDREWRYLQMRAELAQERLGADPAVNQALDAAREVQDRCFVGEAAVLRETEPLERRLGTLSAQINRALSPDADLAVSFAQPYSRLEPYDLVPAPTVQETELQVLPGEYHAAGLVVANCLDKQETASVAIEGLPADQFACRVRRQAFLETWYKRENERLADPLCLLPSSQGEWRLTLEPGEVAKLYLSNHCLERCASTDVKLRINSTSGQVGELLLSVRVAGEQLPQSVRFGHTAFIYPGQDRSREATAVDLGSHGVNRMEFTHLPRCKFSKEGELIEAVFAWHEAWLKAYSPHVEKMMIFWPAYGDGFTCADGTKLELLSEPGRRALVNLLRAFFERMSQLGYGMDRFAILPFDETHSKALQNSPDENVARTVEVMKLLREEFPDLEIMMTLTYYAFPKDVEAMTPHLDVALPIFGWPAKLTRNAPPSYNPRKAFAESIWPTLDAEREKRGMEIWSYHIASGKSDDVLLDNRAYPIRAVGAGMTGVGTWAYNAYTGSTWDDTDGKPWVDYIFVYDGGEDHTLNKQLNPTGERVVPSIRWEALRAGIQDARLLLHLKKVAAQDACPGDLKADIQSLLNRVEAMAADDGVISWKAVAEVARRARQLHAHRKSNDWVRNCAEKRPRKP